MSNRNANGAERRLDYCLMGLPRKERLAWRRPDGGLLATIGVVNATYVRVKSMGLGESFAANSNAGGPASVSSKLAFTLPIFGETGMDFVRGTRGRKSKSSSWGLLPRPARDCPEDQFRAIGVPREAT